MSKKEVSEEDFNAVVQAVSDVVSGFCLSASLRAAERTYQTWKSGEPALICEVEFGHGVPVLYRGIAFASAGWSEARRLALEDMSRKGGWPLAFSGDEMRLRLSLLPENELRELSWRCAHGRALSMLRTAPA